MPLAFVGLLASAAASGELAGRAAGPGAVTRGGRSAPRSPPRRRRSRPRSALPASRRRPWSAAVIAWTQLFGMISFELFGQFVGSFEPADALFACGRSASSQAWPGSAAVARRAATLVT